MNAWRAAPVAWVWQADDIIVVPVDRALQQPLRLTGSAVDCWIALIEADAAISARALATALSPSTNASVAHPTDVDSIAADIEVFFSSLSMSGVVTAE